MKKQIASTRAFIKKHQTHILLTSTAVSTTIAVVTRVGLAQHDEFLKKHGLYEEFYNSED